MKALRRIGLGLVLACVALLAGGCAAGQHAATAEEKPAIDAEAGAILGDIYVRAVAVQPPPAGTSYPTGSSAPLQAVFVNTGHSADTLTDVSTKAASGWGVFADQTAFAASASSPASSASASPTGPSGAKRVVIPPGTSVGFGVPTATKVLGLTGLTGTLFTAQTVTVTFTFTNAGTVSLPVPVQLSTRPLTSVLPSAPVTP